MAEELEFGGFVRGYIRTVWAVELLLLLMRDPGRCWGRDALERELRASQTLVSDILARFESCGLTAPEPDGVRYAPATLRLAELCQELEQTYRERPVFVINTIAAAPSPLESFANAFRFREKDR